MRLAIAKVRIAAGNPGWYDPLTNIHLTITKPEAFVYESDNVTNIKTAVKYKLVHVVEGELEPIRVTVPAPEEKVDTTPIESEEVRDVVPEEPKVEDKVEEKVEEKEEVKAEEEIEVAALVEEVSEPVVEEKKTAKKTAAKKATKKKAE